MNHNNGSHSVWLWLRTLLAFAAILGVLLAANSSSAQSSSQWSLPIDITQPSGSSQGSWGLLLCDQYQNTHIFWSGSLPDGDTLYYRNNINGGWSSPVDVVMIPDQYILRTAGAISNKTDTIHLVWTEAEQTGGLYYSSAPLQSASDPRAWSTPRKLADNTRAGSIVIDSTGVIHLAYGITDKGGQQPAVEYTRSEDDGLTWSEPVTAYATATSVPVQIGGVLAVDESGHIHVGITTRSIEYGIYSEVGYIRSLDGGKTWGPYFKVTNTGTTFQGVSGLVPYAFGKNEVHLTWHDPRRMHMWSNDGGQTWSAPEEIMPLGAAFGGPNKLVKDSAGILHAILAAFGGVYSVSWDGTQWGPPELIDDRGIDPHNQDMVVCQGNELHVTYDDRNDQKKVWYSTRTVNAPHIDPKPFPRHAEAAAIGLEPTPTPLPIRVLSGSQNHPFSPDLKSAPPSPVALILLSALPVLVLIAGVYLARRWRR